MINEFIDDLKQYYNGLIGEQIDKIKKYIENLENYSNQINNKKSEINSYFTNLPNGKINELTEYNEIKKMKYSSNISNNDI